MKVKIILQLGFSFLVILLMERCTATHKSAAALPDLTTLNFKVEAAPEWTELLHRNAGWFGADGIFVIPKSGNDYTVSDSSDLTVFFSDTMIGELEADGGAPKPGYKMVHNSVALLKGNQPKKENIQFNWKQDNEGNPQTFFIPNTPLSKPGDYYWMGDGFVNRDVDNNTYMFAYRIRDTADGRFLFTQVGNALIVLPEGSKPPYENQRQVDAPVFIEDTTSKYPNNYVSYGSAVFANTKSAGVSNPDGYVYVYAVSGELKKVSVARVKSKDFENFSKWKYWDGTTWISDISMAAKIADRASNELSVSPLPDGRYVMVFQTDGLGNSVGMRLGTTPYGPFGPIIKIWDCTEQQQSKNFIVYNAKAHPALSKPGELIITYNVGSFDFWNDIKVYGNFYRPRFIRLKLQ